MTEWLPVLFGLAYAALLGAPLWLFPRSRWTREVLRPIGFRPSGPGGTLARRDYLRSGSALILGGAPALLLGAFLCFAAANRLPALSQGAQMGEGFAFVFLS